MKTIPFREFLDRHNLHVTIMEEQRMVGVAGLLRLRQFEKQLIAALRSSNEEGFHFGDGGLVEGVGATKLEAFERLLEGLNHHTRYVKGPFYASRRTRFTAAVSCLSTKDLFDGSDLIRELV